MSSAVKFLVAVAAAVAMALQSYVTDGVTNAEWVQVAIAAATAASVWLTANVPTLIWAKAATACLLGGLGALASFIANDNEMTTSQWINVLIAAAGALGVYLADNQGDYEDQVTTA